jgi:dihydroflavonol-4-reductase
VTLNLVTGAAGFVGKSLVAALQAKGERVRSFDLKPAEGDEIVIGSVTDEDAARRAAKGVDFVFHLAGAAQLWAPDARLFDQINRGGTQAMLAAAKSARVRRFIHCSSLTTLVGRRTPKRVSEASESTRLDAADMLGPYPLSKLRADRAVEDAAAEGLDAVIALPTEPLGAGDDALTPPTRMILDFVNRKTPAYVDCTLNFVPVKSLAEGLVAARERGIKGERYLLGGENVAMPRLLAAIEKIAGVPTPKVKLPFAIAYAAGAIDSLLLARVTRKPPKAPLTGVRLAARPVTFSSAKAARDLGWRADPFEPALEETIGWMRAKGLAV